MKNKDITKFNIRVYGLLINNKNEILLSDEFVFDTYMTKFPGGGLEFGEGPEDCIKRECIEELGQEILIKEHFYTTGFFQKALFYNDHQLISIYYIISLKDKPRFKISTKAVALSEKLNGSQSFRWTAIENIQPEKVTFPIDKYVVKLLRKRFLN